MSRTWRDKHKHWEYRFWTDETNREFIKLHFPFFLPVYDGYPTAIQRVDAVRYFVLLQYGGFYIDMDFECLSSIDPLAELGECIFGKEPPEHCLLHGKDLIISNAFMGAVPGCRFLAQVCKALEDVRDITDHRNNMVLESTGPFMLSHEYSRYPDKAAVTLLEPGLLYPLTKDELEEWGDEPFNAAIRSRAPQAYGIHRYIGTWWKSNVV
jgi:mannosyltransferase OCH1-like enzyme